MEGHGLQATKIVHHHANGRFDWLISEPSREVISILCGKYKGFTFVHPMNWTSSNFGLSVNCLHSYGEFLVISEITRCHTFTKEINPASDHSQYFNENFYCKNCLGVFSAMSG